jgi:tetratricopeptide (TPR) repeat protein
MGKEKKIEKLKESSYKRAYAKLEKAGNEIERFYALGAIALASVDVGKYEDAKKYANKLKNLMPNYQKNWNYGNAIQDVNVVLGRLAVIEKRIDDAKYHLLEAGKSPGSPTMNSFGPNMSLAKDLLEKGEKDVVLEYFELCRKFWANMHGSLDKWVSEVKDGNIPDFGGNLFY